MKALGQHVILVSQPPRKGDEQFSGGIFIGVQETHQLPELCEVYSIGEGVPPGFINVGDLVPLPVGNIRNVPTLQVAMGLKKSEDEVLKYVTCHYSAIPCVYNANLQQ